MVKFEVRSGSHSQHAWIPAPAPTFARAGSSRGQALRGDDVFLASRLSSVAPDYVAETERGLRLRSGRWLA
jgi:hypothetical protein